MAASLRSALVARLLEAAGPIVAFLGVVVVGVAGFVALAGVTVVDAAFWLLDPTSIEIHFQNHDGPEQATKAFAVVVFSGLVVAGLWIGETVLDTLVGGQIGEELRRVQTQQTIDSLADHVVVCGYGMFGRTVVERLQAAGHDVVVVEQDESEFEGIDEETLAVRGDAREESVLVDAGIERAATVVAAIDDSNANIQIAMIASQVAPDLRVVVRVGDQQFESMARRAGADEVVIPEVVSATAVSDRL